MTAIGLLTACLLGYCQLLEELGKPNMEAVCMSYHAGPLQEPLHLEQQMLAFWPFLCLVKHPH